jgi:serine phosphatase RsbU (regulator of sigma subunit)
LKKPEEILLEFKKKVSSIEDKRLKVIAIIDFAMIYGDSYGNKIVPILDEGITLAREIGFDGAEAICYHNLNFFNVVTQGRFISRHMDTIPDNVTMLEKLKTDINYYSMGLSLMAYQQWFKGEYEKGFDQIFEAIKHSEENNIPQRGWHYFALAVFYFDTKDFENSAINYQIALDHFSIENHEYGKARSITGLGTIAIMQNRTGDAVPLLQNAAQIYRELGHYSGLSRALNDLGLLEKVNTNYKKAIGFLNESIELRKEIDHVQGLITSYTELGETYLLMGECSLALEQFQQGLLLALEAKTKQKQMRLHQLFYTTFKKLDNTDKALQNFEKFYELKTQLLSDEASNNIKKIQSRFEKEKSEKETEIERLKNVELKKANAIIEQKNKDITDSINYAKRIQLAILPSTETLESCFKNYFVFYQPKDIVSGDFYWAVRSKNSKTNKVLSIIAAVDCTGHGVPGAFMSMLGNTLLNQTIVNPSVVQPSDVLDYLNEKLPENLKSTGQDQNIRDGMDMSLCIFDFQDMKLEFAGANNPCLIIRDGKLIEIKGDKQAISASNDIEKKKFTNNIFDLKKNDCIYLFTDGYADQFGGSKGKKFKYRQLQELLLNNSDKPLEQQKNILEKTMQDWKGKLEQVDDILVIGVRV